MFCILGVYSLVEFKVSLVFKRLGFGVRRSFIW